MLRAHFRAAPSARGADTTGYVRYERGAELPRIPLKASLDLTYRCNNRCRHCWLWTADTAEERARELTTDEWREVVDQSRALGVHEWAISGGEPMLREDFSELFEYATAKATSYTLNTNGTLITPAIARLLTRKGVKMVAVYGATAEVYDHVARNPGGFDLLLRGLNDLKEAGAGFIVQLVPMRDNWQQWDEMVGFAESWSKHWRVGAPWLFKTASGDVARNSEIDRQRLDPADVVALEPPVAPRPHEERPAACGRVDGRPYAACVGIRRDFHVDPHGGMSFCAFVKDAALRSDLRKGRFRGIGAAAGRRAWDESIPAAGEFVPDAGEAQSGCADCELGAACRWCDVYGFLEHGRHGAKVEYLCAVAGSTRDARGS